MAQTFSEEVYMLPSCEDIRSCIQCGTCSATCPVVEYMTHSPRKLFAMIRADMEGEVLESNTIWFCASCYSCTVRCPMDIKITDVMYALKEVALKKNKGDNRLIAPHFAKRFNGLIEKYGRVFEPELTPAFIGRVGIGGMIDNALFGLSMFTKGRLPILPKRLKGLKGFQKTLKKAHQLA